MTSLFNPPRWFTRELVLVRPDLHAWFNNKTLKWEIWADDSCNRIVEDDQHRRLPLDQRILRKLRFDFYLTRNPKARDAYVDGDKAGVRAYVDGGDAAVNRYLRDYNKGAN